MRKTPISAEPFNLTTSAIAVLAGAPECRVRKLADLGALPHVRDNVGRRLFPASAAETVRGYPVGREHRQS